MIKKITGTSPLSDKKRGFKKKFDRKLDKFSDFITTYNIRTIIYSISYIDYIVLFYIEHNEKSDY